MESAVTHIQPPELELTVGQSQRNSYPAARTRVGCRMESAATRIQPLELKSAVGGSQPQLLSSHRNPSQP